MMKHYSTPADMFGDLFRDVQTAGLFADSKLFVDAVPRRDPAQINAAYQQRRDQPDFKLGAFFAEHFVLPDRVTPVPARSGQMQAREAIEGIWDQLSRPADKAVAGSSLIALPHPYVVPGGRFRELYYWDSYFTILGLLESGRPELVRNMLDNFAYLIDTVGHIPNGNRTYYCSRSQIPFFAMMVEAFSEAAGDQTLLVQYLPQLLREHQFWMSGADEDLLPGEASRRAVRWQHGFLNRYWDDATGPREESYREDLSLAASTDRVPDELYRDIRAACESGWDFSSRWCNGSADLADLVTTQIVPVDLNCVMWKLEDVIARASKLAGDLEQGQHFSELAANRKTAIQSLFFDAAKGWFADLVLPDFEHGKVISLAGMFPLYFGLATQAQATLAADTLEKEFTCPGGWVTTAVTSGQQWDAPNGWAPLQWITLNGLRRYGFTGQADKGARAWVVNNLDAFARTGLFFEKYNVVDPAGYGAGGEYEPQTGFGWTNAILLKMLKGL